MYQKGILLINSRHSGEAFNINTEGDPYTWILLNSQSTTNVFCNRKLLSEVEHTEGAMVIHCNVSVVYTYLTGMIPIFEQEKHGIIYR